MERSTMPRTSNRQRPQLPAILTRLHPEHAYAGVLLWALVQAQLAPVVVAIVAGLLVVREWFRGPDG
jgi:hypothetical protein